jgi:hypothetical protein
MKSKPSACFRNFKLSILVLGLALALAFTTGAKSASAQGCFNDFPVLTDSLFSHLKQLKRLQAEPDGMAKYNQYMADNNLDLMEISLANAKLSLNSVSQTQPDLNIIETSFPGCTDDIVFTPEEKALFKKYFPDGTF